MDTTNCRLYTSICRLYSLKCKCIIDTSNCRLYTSNCRLYTSNCRIYSLICLYSGRFGFSQLLHNVMDREYLIGEYFKLGLNYSEIIQCLEEFHGYTIGIRTLKRITKNLGFYRRKYKSDIFFTWTMWNARSSAWLRLIYLKCLEKGLVVDQESVVCCIL